MSERFILRKNVKKLRFRERLFFTLLIIGLVAAAAAFVSAVIAELDLFGLMASGSCGVFLLAILAYVYKTQNFRRAEIITCLGFNFIIFPVNFICSGGLNGGMPMYFVCGAVIIRLLMSKKQQIPLQIIYFLYCSALFVFAYSFPEYIIPYSSPAMQLVDMIMSLGITTVLIGWCVDAILSSYEADHEKLEKLNYQLAEMAARDGLTNLYNRRYFMIKLEQYMRSAEKNQRDLSLIMFDIDFFKQINDTYGHLAGDEVLRNFSSILGKCVGDKALIGRYGGEEFVLMLPDMSPEAAYRLADEIRERVEESVLANGVKAPITVSGGISFMHKNCRDIRKLISVADNNLYRAKELGRNQISYC